jgi:hypothetical protein
VCVWLSEGMKVFDKIPKSKRTRGDLRFRSCLFAGITVRKRHGNGDGRMKKVLAFMDQMGFGKCWNQKDVWC